MKKISVSTRSLAALAMMIATAGLGSPVVVHGAGMPEQTKTAPGQKESPNVKIAVAPTVTEKEHKHGRGFKVIKHENRMMQKNQRQYQKMTASNPHIRSSKKHRSKN